MNRPVAPGAGRPADAKARIRAFVRDRLRTMTADARAALAERVEERVWSIPEVASAGTILLYASIGSEVPTDSIAREARTRGIRTVYPRCLPEVVAMSLHEVDGPGGLVDGGRFGIREPAPECPIVDLSDIDVAFLPGLAWDRGGSRLGRGAGFYDRLFEDPRHPPVRCGLFFSVQEVPDLPVDPWDVPLDLVVTEKEVVRF